MPVIWNMDNDSKTITKDMDNDLKPITNSGVKLNEERSWFLISRVGMCHCHHYWGGWSSGYGLTPKGLGGGGPTFESCNGKCLGNNSMLSTHTH